MPFPLAHPVAVLPLRRYCPRLFDFPALVVGSISPDVGYAFGHLHIENFSHRFVGSLGFCLPVGALMLTLFFLLRVPVVTRLPERYRRLFMPLCLRPPGPPLVIIFSLLVGTWTHLLWDSLTHKSGWFVRHLPVLQIPLASMGTHSLRVFGLLWYICSFVGVVWLWLEFEKWKQASEGAATLKMGRAKLNAVVVGTLAVTIGLVRHLLVAH